MIHINRSNFLCFGGAVYFIGYVDMAGHVGNAEMESTDIAAPHWYDAHNNFLRWLFALLQ